ncbi:DNA-formamidopyrimidine glycosylase family protein [Luteococcus sp. H138]|uniref:Fpg/Nei family DNA glycosylase n=1 Tax=unclassified Luteococcus TaxID=2639923 RepID=UPI00313C9A97
MPELPEVEALRTFLDERLTGRSMARVNLAAFSALKTFEYPLDSLLGLQIERVHRHGKFLDVEAQGMHLCFHLARAGWVRWHDAAPTGVPKPGKGPLSLRVVLDDDAGFDLTEAGTQRKLALHVVDDPQRVPLIATLGPDPLADDFTPEVFDQILTNAGKAQLKGVLRDQRTIAGIGNAYSDEILHAARLSPFKGASTLTEEERLGLYRTLRETLATAVAHATGLAAKELKDNKRSHLRVHGRTGDACAVCGTTIAEVSFADSSLQYCPGCQTGGKVLADRRMSRLLK